ncbi:thioredoxin-like protein [Dunaliella salina]|uniref:Thioredoxin-like protein n=1 Tax=Dunaliella salina TaxID=3046 RepID=A0ABQ7G7Z4_DUNSA|nr:thioredoxin-like protein [Dunaliella salina]|eukprot:KAF5830731.1 thioredoxin-like protein [Dunaliella salina]
MGDYSISARFTMLRIGHCKRLAPTWKELASAYKDNDKIVIAHVDCTASRDVCSAAGIKGYPSLKVIHKADEYKAFKGSRDLPSLKAFVEEAAAELTSETN